jgi:hypothetical protein
LRLESCVYSVKKERATKFQCSKCKVGLCICPCFVFPIQK